MSAWVREKLRAAFAALGSSRAERATSAVTLLLVALGFVLRSRGYLFRVRPLWWDEASWAMHLMQGRHADDAMRPLGFLGVSRAFGIWFSPSERWLRALSWFSGLATLFVSPFLARRLFTQSAARLLFVAVLALHPAAIDLSKEFKPYSESLALHVGLLFLALRYVESRSSRDLSFVLGLGAVAMFFAQDVVFAYPGIFLVLGYEAYRHRRSHLAFIVLGAVVVLVGLGAQYLFVWSQIPRSDSGYWGDKYGVFFTSNGPESYFSWAFRKLSELAEFPGYRRVLWARGRFPSTAFSVLRRVDALAWVFLHVAGLVVLARKKRARDALLLVLPLFTLWLFNALRFWPYGAFRANLFAVSYLAAIAAVALDVPQQGRNRMLVPVFALALVLVPLVLFERDWHRTKRAMAYDGYLPDTLARVEALRKNEKKPRREPLLLGMGLCSEWQYYTLVHPGGPELLEELKPLFQTRCVHEQKFPEVARNAIASSSRVFAVVKEPVSEDLMKLKADSGKPLRVTRRSALGGYRILMIDRPAR